MNKSWQKNRRIEFFSVNNSKPRSVSQKIAEYPYHTEEGYTDPLERPFEKLNNLVQGNDNRHFYLINTKFFYRDYKYDNVLSILKIQYQPTSFKLSVEDTFSKKLEGEDEYVSGAPVAFDSKERVLFFQSLRVVENGECRTLQQPLLGNQGIFKEISDVIGGGIVDDTRIAFLFGERDAGCDYLEIFQIAKGCTGGIYFAKKNAVFKSGITVHYWHNDVTSFNPVAISPLKNELAFFANLPIGSGEQSNISYHVPEYKHVVHESIKKELKKNELCLAVFDINRNSLVKRFKIKDWGCFLERSQATWCPDPKRNLVAAYCNLLDWNSTINESKALLVDMDSGQILKSWVFKNKLMRTKEESDTFYKYDNIPVKSIRWSPDGSRVGFLTVDGQLFIYDVEKDTTTCVAEDRDYFDFYWVE